MTRIKDDHMPFYPPDINENEIRKEKEKARKLRKTNWWNAKIQKGECHYCGKKVGKDQLTMDHIVPISRGGKSRKGNLVPSCKECNNKKKYLLPVEWEEYLNSLAEETSKT
jgi:5-methylcytosine-specific restriction endonuclease McrA